MKKRIIILLTFIVICINCFAGSTIKYFNGIDDNGRIPTCYTIKCPKCSELRAKGLSDGGLATRHGKQYVTDEKGNRFIEYLCSHGHQTLICYDGPDFKGNK